MRIAGNDFFELARQQSTIFESDNVTYCELLVNSNCPRSILNMVYNRLVREGKLLPVEDMYQQDKESVWGMAKGFAKGRLGKTALVELVKALLALEYFLNLEVN